MPVRNALVRGTAAPPIPQVQAWGRAYGGGRGPLIDLCQAVPGYPPPPALLDRLAAAAQDRDAARYGPIPGDAALREAYAAHLSARYGAAVDPAGVAITAGCNQAFFAALLCLVPPGGTVLLPTPWYYNHRMTCDMLGLRVRALPCTAEQGFVPDPDAAAALMDGVHAVVLITPNNPTGAIYPAETIARFAALCRARDAWLVVDETYRDFLPHDHGAPHALLRDGSWADNAVLLYSFSKAYALPGQRVGALATSAALMPDFLKALDCLHICPNRAGQAALAWGIGTLSDWRAANRAEMAHRAAVLRDCFRAIPQWRIDSQGAYFAYVRHPFPDQTGWQVVEHLARTHGVLLLPASAFAGGEQHLRVSFANVGADGIAALAERLGGVPTEALAA